MVGIEVINKDDRYPFDRVMWDNVLTLTAPERQVFGFANDDAHRPSEIGTAFNELLVTTNSIDNVKGAIQNGKSFLYKKIDAGALPVVTSIVVVNNTITVNAKNYAEIKWISCGDIVSESNTISVDGLSKYVRFILKNNAGELLSQPFFIRGR